MLKIKKYKGKIYQLPELYSDSAASLVHPTDKRG